jgi:transposase
VPLRPAWDFGPDAQRLISVAQRSVASALRRRAREGKSSFSGRPSLTAEEVVVRLLYGRCAGLDIHKDTVSACIRMHHGAKTEIETAVFGTFTEQLEQMRDWLRGHKIEQVAMESTGVYWIPVWNVLENADCFELTLVNPQHVRALPGCKTDRRDANRIAELLQYGLLRGSFIPPRPVRELRDLTRRRTHLQGDRNRVINRISRLLEMANIKLGQWSAISPARRER